MADTQPPAVVEGATTGDVEDEVKSTAKSAEDRKAAAALSNLEASGKEEGATSGVDQEAAANAINALGGAAPEKPADKKEIKKVKIDSADVALLVSLFTIKYWNNHKSLG